MSSGGIVALESVRRRIEAFLFALYNRRFSISATDAPASIGWWRRHVLRRGPHLRASRAMPATDGSRIWLPYAIRGFPAVDGSAVFRALALIQAEIASRGAPHQMAEFGSALERDLFTLYEGANAEHAISSRHLSFAGAVAALRRHAHGHGVPWPARSNGFIADLREEILTADPREWPAALPRDLDAVGARSWATATASRFNPRLYFPLRPVWHWGAMVGTGSIVLEDPTAMRQPDAINLPIGGAPQSSSRDRGAVSRQTRSAGTSDSTSEKGPASTGVPSESGTALDPWNETSRDIPGIEVGAAAAARYHEWDYVLSRFERDRVTVFESRVGEGDPGWARETAVAHRGLIRRVEREFRALGARRARLPRQPDGDEIDLQAVVDLHVAFRSRGAPDERVYSVTRPPRGDVALALLADVSGSAETALVPGLRIIDVEKTALLVATHALEATGDRHAILAFASRGAPRVAIRTAKSFSERGGVSVGARIAALSPAGNTRLGAAIRHAAHVLLQERASRHLLLVVSDGIPNDSDGYVDDYGIEDARMAVLEARARGVMPHCLTLSADEHYALRIFGAAAQVWVRRPEHLPAAMLQVLGRLLRH